MAAGDDRAFVRIVGNLARLPLAIWRNLGRRARRRVEPETWESVVRHPARRLAGVAGRVELSDAA